MVSVIRTDDHHCACVQNLLSSFRFCVPMSVCVRVCVCISRPLSAAANVLSEFFRLQLFNGMRTMQTTLSLLMSHNNNKKTLCAASSSLLGYASSFSLIHVAAVVDIC